MTKPTLRTSPLSLRKKLLLLPILYLVGLIILEISHFYTQQQVQKNVIIPGFSRQALAGHAGALKSSVQIEATTLGNRIKTLGSRTEQVAAIIAETDPIRFFEDGSGYFFTYDLQGVRINVPTDKSGNGKNFLEMVDPNGVRFVEAMVQAAKKGGGFIEYSFIKPGKGITPKMAYVTLIPGTDILVGTGVYIDNVESELEQLRSAVETQSDKYFFRSLVLFGAILALIVTVSVWIAESTGRSIRTAITQLLANAKHNTAAAGQVSDASQSLAQGASEQASSLEETSSSLEEMSSMTKRNAGNAFEASQLARDARKAADAGAEDMQTMSNAMVAIKSSSDDIAKIIKTIDEIAFQTNILALNAAVEAARAGDAGMGFAVVADEVRALAQRSAIAAKETATQIESALNKSAEGVLISTQVTARLNEIVEKIRKVDGLISDVATASKEQNQGVQEINSAISQMDIVVQRNASGAEESAAAAEELNAHAVSLNEIISNLSDLIGGTAHVVSARHEPNEPATKASKRTTTREPAAGVLN